MTQKSEQIDKLMAALSKAQKEFKEVSLDCYNPFHKAKYASLSAIKDSYQQALSDNGLFVSQMPDGDVGGHSLITILGHSSGQWLSCSLPLILGKDDMQGLGAAITYARRYSLPAILGIVDSEDDNGVGANKQAVRSTADKANAELKEKLDKAPNFAPQKTAIKEKTKLPEPTNGEINSAIFKPEDYVVEFGKNKGKTLKELGKSSVQATIDWIEKDTKPPRTKSLSSFIDYGKMFLIG